MVELLKSNNHGEQMLQNLVTPFWNVISQILCSILLLFNIGEPVMHSTLIEHLFNCDQIVIYNNGTEIKTDKEMIFTELEKLTDKSYFSPAFGVSLHEQTLQAKQKGIWIEFVYNETHEFAEMPFDKLLIELKPNFYGFNLIRYQSGKYEGRCFYLNLNHSSTKFYDFIVSLIKIAN